MVRRISSVAAVVAGFVLAVASPAAAVEVGQLAPGSSPDALCGSGPNDSLSPTVTSGNSYVIPALSAPYGMTVTSWSTNAAAGEGQMLTFKVFRKTGVVDGTVNEGANPLWAKLHSPLLTNQTADSSPLTGSE
jgi:hypothetical protein